MSEVVRIKPLIDIADELQMSDLKSDTEFYLAAKLYNSLEEWEQKLNDLLAFAHVSIYWLAYDTFHCAKAFDEVSKTRHKKVGKIIKTMEKIMKEYEPISMNVFL